MKLIITEEERSRILGMHQNATTRQYLKEDPEKDLCLTLATNIVNALNAKINDFKTKNPNSPTSTFTVKKAGDFPTKEGEIPRYGIFYAGKDLFNQQGFSDGDLVDSSMMVDQNRKDQSIIRYRNMINSTFNATNLDTIFAKAGTKNLGKINQMGELNELALKILNDWAIEIQPKLPTTKKSVKTQKP